VHDLLTAVQNGLGWLVGARILHRRPQEIINISTGFPLRPSKAEIQEGMVQK